MKPEAEAHLDRARVELDDAARALVHGLYRLAARSAYYAAFRAAEALIVERSGKVAKTHNGVRSEFSRLWRETPRTNSDLIRVLTRGYVFKEIADYGSGPTEAITEQVAAEMIDAAVIFVARLSEVLSDPPTPERG